MTQWCTVLNLITSGWWSVEPTDTEWYVIFILQRNFNKILELYEWVLLGGVRFFYMCLELVVWDCKRYRCVVLYPWWYGNYIVYLQMPYWWTTCSYIHVLQNSLSSHQLNSALMPPLIQSNHYFLSTFFCLNKSAVSHFLCKNPFNTTTLLIIIQILVAHWLVARLTIFHVYWLSKTSLNHFLFLGPNMGQEI